MDTLYLAESGWLGRLHPLTKLAAAAPVLAAAYLLPWLWLPPLLLAGLLALAHSAGLGAALLRRALLLLGPIVLSLVLIQGLLFPPAGAPLALGPLRTTDAGLRLAGLVAGRLAVLTAAMLLVLLSTHPADLALALGRVGLPRSAGYVLLVALQLVPEMRARAGAILEAQQARGLALGGLRRVRAIVPLLGPLVVGALADVEERAMAIESRAYLAPGPKTALRQLRDTPGQRRARRLFLLATLALAAYALLPLVRLVDAR